jgi:GNAT superfamily N-acetyltransferase
MKSTVVSGLELRTATSKDAGLILAFIKKLAEYEKLSHEVVATEWELERTLFGPKPFAEVAIAELKGKPVGFALFFHNYSTFLGKPGLYLEDLFVEPETRGLGVGKALLIYLAKLAEERGCGRFEWAVLDWNEPSIRFYESLGAVAMKEWTVYRETGQALTKLASQNL